MRKATDLAQPLAPAPVWLASAEKLIADFAAEHDLTLAVTERQVSAAFEIACLLSLLRFYKRQKYTLKLENLQEDGYRYLTTPSGNPANFSFVTVEGLDGNVDPDIRFTPDIIVLRPDSKIDEATDPDFASGKRKLFSVKSDRVVAAHECKSMNPFPELMVSFIGMLVTAHKWYPDGKQVCPGKQGHLAPTLFIGGTARAFYMKMITALQSSYRLNIVVGMHAGTWNLTAAVNRFTWGPVAVAAPTPPPTAVVPGSGTRLKLRRPRLSEAPGVGRKEKPRVARSPRAARGGPRV
jgi:hypothetical protein